MKWLIFSVGCQVQANLRVCSHASQGGRPENAPHESDAATVYSVPLLSVVVDGDSLCQLPVQLVSSDQTCGELFCLWR